MSEISAVWERIEAWYEAQGATDMLEYGASAQAITATEQKLGLAFPIELRDSLLRHDGSGSLGWPGGELLSLERIADERQVWMELVADGIFDDDADHNANSLTVQPGWWNPGWIPLQADGGGNGMVVDTVPAAQGALGQVLFMDHEIGPSEAIHPSLSAYLKQVCTSLENGEFVFENGAIISGDDL